VRTFVSIRCHHPYSHHECCTTTCLLLVYVSTCLWISLHSTQISFLVLLLTFQLPFMVRGMHFRPGP